MQSMIVFSHVTLNSAQLFIYLCGCFDIVFVWRRTDINIAEVNPELRRHFASVSVNLISIAPPLAVVSSASSSLSSSLVHD